VYRVVPQSGRAKTPQSGRALRPKVAVDKRLMHMVFGDKCAATAPRLLRLAESPCTLDHRKGWRVLNDQRKTGKRKTARTFHKLGQCVLPLPKQNTIIQKRLIDTAGLLAESDEKQPITFQHSILCQTSLPYRDPGPDVRRWKRRQGDAVLEVEAGRAMHPEKGDFVDLALPFGPKPRLVLAHLNSEALRCDSPEIEIENSLTAFVKRLKFDPKGRNMRTIKDQLARLSAATVRFGMVRDGGSAITVNSQIVTAFDLWFPKDDRQRVLWPSTVRLSLDYFESLKAHAVPLDERALSALSHSAMALDLYAWLSQRLHRIQKPHRQFIPWPAVKDQFGSGYQSLTKFRQVFMQALRQVCAVYPAAKIDVNRNGLFLYTSPPPVMKTGVVVQLPAKLKAASNHPG
jgi:Plasmid encoded RepA protein